MNIEKLKEIAIKRPFESIRKAQIRKAERNALPDLFKVYNCYNNSTLTLDSQYQVIVTHVIKFECASEILINIYNSVKENNKDLFNESTEYFIETVSYKYDYPYIEYFVNTSLGWISIGEFTHNGDYVENETGGDQLDITGKLTNIIAYAQQHNK